MTPLQKTIHLATTDANFRLALQTDGAAALAQQGLALRPEEMGVLNDLKELLALPTASLAGRFKGGYLSRSKLWD